MKDIFDKVLKEFALDAKDTGTTVMQVALITHKIKNISGHVDGEGRVRANKKDFSAVHGLRMLVVKRNKLLKYLFKKDSSQYNKLIQLLGLRDTLSRTVRA